MLGNTFQLHQFLIRLPLLTCNTSVKGEAKRSHNGSLRFTHRAVVNLDWFGPQLGLAEATQLRQRINNLLSNAQAKQSFAPTSLSSA